MRVTVCQVATAVRYRVFDLDDVRAISEDILYVRLSRFAPLRAVSELLYKELPATIRARSVHVAFQVHPEMWNAMSSDPYLIDDLCGRLDVDQFDLVRIEDATRSHVVETRFRSGAAAVRRPALAPDEVVAVARAADFRDMATRSGAALPETPEFHYEGPNGSHYTAFLRPGFSFASMEDLDAICFWLAPLMPDDAVVVVDTWNLAALGIALLNYVGGWPSGPPPFACVETYEESPDSVAAHVRGIASATGRGSVFLIVSVSGTGKFAEAHLTALQERTRLPVRAVVLYATDRDVLPPSVTTLQDVPSVVRYPAGACERCLSPDTKSPVIRIMPRSYLLELSGAVVQARITRDSAKEARAFFEDVQDSGGFRVHRDQEDGTRHHAIYVDVERLLESPSFQRRCREMAARIAPSRPDVILTPNHRAGHRLAAFLAEELRIPAFPLSDDEVVSRIGAAAYERLREADRVLLIDDVSITGHRLMGYQRALRDAGLVARAGGISLIFAVGVFRPPTRSAELGIREMIPRPNFFYAAKFLLPDWGDEPECPWCQELRLLEDHPVLLERHSSLRDRFDVLAAKSVGLGDHLFLRWRADSIWPRSDPSADEWEEQSRWLQSAEPRAEIDLSYDLGPGSVFGHPTEADLFVTVASAAQVLRSTGELHTDDYQQPLAKVLDPYLYLRGRYYDPVILAAILRATRRHDLRAAAIEKLLRRAVAEKLQHSVYRELRGELLLSIAQGKVPRPYELRTNRQLFTRGDQGMASWLRALVTSVSPREEQR